MNEHNITQHHVYPHHVYPQINPLDDPNLVDDPNLDFLELENLLSLPKLSMETLKVADLATATLKRYFKLTGYEEASIFFRDSRFLVRWMTHSKNLESGVLEKNLQKNMQEIAESPKNMIAWVSSFWAAADLISIPLGILLKANIVPEELVGVLTEVQEKLVKFPLRGDVILHASVHEAFESRLISPLDSVDEKFIKAIEKVDTVTKGIKATAKKLNYKEINLLLGLVSALTKLYTIYLNQKKIEPAELLKLIKIKTELTLKTHLTAIPEVFSESDFASENPEEVVEIYEEIKDAIMSQGSLLSITNNDLIYDDLLRYKQKINDLMEIYRFKVEGFEEEINQLIHECKPLIEYKERLKTHATTLIREHFVFLNNQLKILDEFYTKYQRKISKDDFDKYIKPEFEKEITSILKQIKSIGKASKELQIDKKFHIEPFTILTLEEQRAFYDKIVKKTQRAQKDKIIERINYVCRIAPAKTTA